MSTLLGPDSSPTEREARAVLAVLQPVFGPEDTEATAPTDREVHRVLAALPLRRPRWRSRGMLAGVLLTGTALAAGALQQGWLELVPAPVASSPGPAVLAAPAPEPEVQRAPPLEALPTPAPARSLREVTGLAPRLVPELAPVPVPLAPEVPTVVPQDVSAFSSLLERLEEGERSEALLSELERYAQAHPSSVLSEEATVHALRLRAEVGDPAHALALLDTYLEQHPSREDVVELRADVLRGRLSDCGAAVADYRALSGARDRRRAARALAWRGLCAVEAGSSRDAAALLTASLVAGVESPLRDRVELALASLK